MVQLAPYVPPAVVIAHPAPEVEEPAEAVEVEEPAAAPVLPSREIAIPGYGRITYDPVEKKFVAHCERIGHECCSRTLSKSSHFRGRGRPCGYLTAWLMRENVPCRGEHMKKKPAFSFERRKECRQKLYALPGGRQFAEDCEDEKGTFDEDEPKKVVF